MEEKDVIQMLRHYRHDVLNHLQVIHGYLSMGKTEKVQSKIMQTIEYYNEERKLMSLHAPSFVLWLIQFNVVHMNIRLAYHIHIENWNLGAEDIQLVEQCDRIIEQIEKATDTTELYEGSLQIKEKSVSTLELDLIINGVFQDMIGLMSNLEKMNSIYPIDVFQENDGIGCKFLISIEQK
ncbi:Spo0B domain-containing protein [Virgibacillus byunsanensis]|uniref:Spo0B domain-containing protein n=1 Tax=Virgibacillus byunsanensis TaxID=570945 RepID=A0ABW3LJR0_9BACI